LSFRVNGEQFVEKYKATVGADFYEKEVIVFGNKIFLEVRGYESDLGYSRAREIQLFRDSILSRS
jgi:hypothetical protein